MNPNLTPDQRALLEAINDMEHGFRADWYKLLEDDVKDNLAHLMELGLIDANNEFQSLTVTDQGKSALAG